MASAPGSEGPLFKLQYRLKIYPNMNDAGSLIPIIFFEDHHPALHSLAQPCPNATHTLIIEIEIEIVYFYCHHMKLTGLDKFVFMTSKLSYYLTMSHKLSKTRI